MEIAESVQAENFMIRKKLETEKRKNGLEIERKKTVVKSIVDIDRSLFLAFGLFQASYKQLFLEKGTGYRNDMFKSSRSIKAPLFEVERLLSVFSLLFPRSPPIMWFKTMYATYSF